MERLTRRSENGTGCYATPSGDPIKWDRNRHNVLQKLAEYEDLEEQGRLLRTKCRLGDVVYALWSIPTDAKYVVYPAEVKEINLSSTNIRKMIMYKLEPIAYRGRYNKYYDDDFGKVVFTSQEEAEAALEKMKGEEHDNI